MDSCLAYPVRRRQIRPATKDTRLALDLGVKSARCQIETHLNGITELEGHRGQKKTNECDVE